MSRPHIKKFFQPTQVKKVVFFVLADALLVAIAFYTAFLLRLDFVLTDAHFRFVVPSLPLFLILKIGAFWYFDLYSVSWRFVSIKDLFQIVKAVITSSIVLVAIIYFFNIDFFFGFPRSIIIIDGFLTLMFIAWLRIAKRVFLEVLFGNRPSQGRATIIVGAGNTGELVFRDIVKKGSGGYTPVAFLDDDANVLGTTVHGVRVVGSLEDLTKTIQAYSAKAVIIAIPSLGHRRLRSIYSQAMRAGVKETKIVPRLYDRSRPAMNVERLEDIRIEDLLGRQSVRINFDEIHAEVQDKTVLITGAAGSIGLEIVKQVCHMDPRKVVLYEIDETELHRAQLMLAKEFPGIRDRLRFVIGDVRDDGRVNAIFARHKPDIVFHAAAYKHVPMMESNASEALKVNVMGTYTVARATVRAGAERFVLISTDKAVRPTSIMGATKRIAETIGSAMNESGKTQFLSVRFGNVLGSRGSVLPLFLEQIKAGGPITLTHKDMQRYFMTIPEAVSLVLQASVIGRGGDILVLDMGKPVKILHLAEELLRIHGLKPHDDIDIEMVGMRPGEKLFEEILTAEEGTVATRHEQVFLASGTAKNSLEEIDALVQEFASIAVNPTTDRKSVQEALKRHVRWYQKDESPADAIRSMSLVRSSSER